MSGGGGGGGGRRPNLDPERLGELLHLSQPPTAPPPLRGQYAVVAGESPTRPTAAGRSLLAAPAAGDDDDGDAAAGQLSGLAFRCDGPNLEAVRAVTLAPPPAPNSPTTEGAAGETSGQDGGEADDEWSPTPARLVVLASRPLAGSDGAPSAALAVHVAASDDGRLVAVACDDGTLRCYDVTAVAASGGAVDMSHRWTLDGAHSHTTPGGAPLGSIVGGGGMSGRYDSAAARSGPVRSLTFAPESHLLCMVDSAVGVLSIYDASVGKG